MLTAEQISKVAGFDPDIAEALTASFNGVETVDAPGALSLSKRTSLLSISGTDAFTLADGTNVGDEKIIECSVAASTPVGTVTVATMTGSRTNVALVFNTVGQRVHLEWTATGWREIAIRAAGTDTPAVASTLNPLVLQHVLAIDGTDDWVLPSGTAIGQMQIFKVASAANTPVGTVSGLFYDEDGSADGVDINVDAAADMATVVWDGARWNPIQLVAATVS